MTKNAVLVSGVGTNHQALLDAQARGDIPNGEIAVVVSNVPGAYALERAAKAGVEGITVRKKDYPDTAAFCAALVEELQKRDIGLVVLAGFLSILDEHFVRSFENRIINIHPSLHQAALDYGVKVTGATVHFVNEGADEGPIILQKAVDILPGDTPEVLQKRVMEQAEWKLLPQAVALFCQGKLKVEGRRVDILP